MARTIRFAAETNATQVLDIYAPVVTDTAISFEETPPSRSEMAGRIRNTMEHYPWLACEEAGRVLGYAYAGAFRSRPAYRWAAEVTVYVNQEEQRRGVASALYTSLLGILLVQGFTEALAGITLPNAGSVALHERFGFQRVGVFEKVGLKFETWHDVQWWALHLQQSHDPHGAPTPLPEVRAGSPGLVESLL